MDIVNIVYIQGCKKLIHWCTKFSAPRIGLWWRECTLLFFALNELTKYTNSLSRVSFQQFQFLCEKKYRGLGVNTLVYCFPFSGDMITPWKKTSSFCGWKTSPFLANNPTLYPLRALARNGLMVQFSFKNTYLQCGLSWMTQHVYPKRWKEKSCH